MSDYGYIDEPQYYGNDGRDSPWDDNGYVRLNQPVAHDHAPVMRRRGMSPRVPGIPESTRAYAAPDQPGDVGDPAQNSDSKLERYRTALTEVDRYRVQLALVAVARVDLDASASSGIPVASAERALKTWAHRARRGRRRAEPDKWSRPTKWHGTGRLTFDRRAPYRRGEAQAVLLDAHVRHPGVADRWIATTAADLVKLDKMPDLHQRKQLFGLSRYLNRGGTASDPAAAQSHGAMTEARFTMIPLVERHKIALALASVVTADLQQVEKGDARLGGATEFVEAVVHRERRERRRTGAQWFHVAKYPGLGRLTFDLRGARPVNHAQATLGDLASKYPSAGEFTSFLAEKFVQDNDLAGLRADGKLQTLSRYLKSDPPARHSDRSSSAPFVGQTTDRWSTPVPGSATPRSWSRAASITSVLPPVPSPPPPPPARVNVMAAPKPVAGRQR